MTIVGTILTIGETALFYKSFVEELTQSSDLLTGFLSALDLFATSMGGGGMETLNLGRIKFHNHMINNEARLRLVIIADQASNEAELNKVIDKIEGSVIPNYKIKEFEEYSSQPAHFNNLDPMITDIVYEVNRASFNQISPIENLPYPVQEQRELNVDKESLSFLSKVLKKDLAKVVFGLFIGMRVVVTGDPDLVSSFIDSMETFSPYRTLRKAKWVDTLDTSGYDIIGVPENLFDLYLDSVRVNLTKKSAVGVKRNKNFYEIIKRIEKLKAEKVLPYIKERFDLLFKKLRAFVDLINAEELSNKTIEKFSKTIDRATLKVLESFFYWNYPKFYPRIKKVSDQIRNLLFAEEVLL